MLGVHTIARTWDTAIDQYIALTEFSREKFIHGGLPAGRIVVKPNFLVDDPGTGDGQGGYALFVGRLTEEKGVRDLLTAWKTLGEKLPLKVVGDGPLASLLTRRAVPGVAWYGTLPRHRVFELMKSASMLIFPSTWYEGFGLGIIEAYATGLPVIAANLGCMAELVRHGKTGLLFTPREPESLVNQVEHMLAHPSHAAKMRGESRREYSSKYTSDINYEILIDIYSRVLAQRGPAGDGSSR
jgi:glycosyltransferase involved in cell wall biosynthesis